MRHHNQHAGLQEHSVGEIYPWTIRGRGYHNVELEPFHCLTGEIGPRFEVTNQGWQTAYRSAEKWVADRVAAVDKAMAIRRSLSSSKAPQPGEDFCPHCGESL